MPPGRGGEVLRDAAAGGDVRGRRAGARRARRVDARRGRLRADPGHEAADAGVWADGLARGGDELDRREVRVLDRRARRARRRPADHRDDLLDHGEHRLVVLALLRAPPWRLGARRGRRGGRAAAPAPPPPAPSLDFPREILHGPRAIVERVFDVERWEEPSYGGHFPALEAPDVLA